MANIIQDIINLDLEASEKVAKLTKQREQLVSFLDYERQQIVKRLTKEMNEKVNNYKKEVESDIELHRFHAQERNEQIKVKLNHTYKLQSDSWIEDIFNHCIG
ncbi:MAG: hypothetical protein WCQ80_01330 [Bacilli bacterium]